MDKKEQEEVRSKGLLDLKVFVWDEDFATDYASGMCVVIAENLGDAIEVARKVLPNCYMEDLARMEPTVHALEKNCFYVQGGS